MMEWEAKVLSKYNHLKHKDLPGHVRGILQNQTSDRPNKADNTDNKNADKIQRKWSVVKNLDRKIHIATNSMLSLPNEHVQTFNSIWFGLVEYIEDCTRRKNLDEISKTLLEKLVNSQVYSDDSEITSRQDISDRIGELEKIVNEFID